MCLWVRKLIIVINENLKTSRLHKLLIRSIYLSAPNYVQFGAQTVLCSDSQEWFVPLAGSYEYYDSG